MTFSDAVLGTTIEIPTIDSKAKVKVEEGTQSGKILRLRNKGLPSVNGYEGKGDMLVTLQIWTPKNISNEEKSILEKLSESPNFQPDPSSKDRSFFSRVKDYFE